MQQAQQKHDTQIADIKNTYKAKRETLESQTENKRSRVTSSAESSVIKAQKNFEYENLLLENIADGTITKSNQQREVLKRSVAATQQNLNQLHTEADNILKRYRQPLPTWDTQHQANGNVPDELDSRFDVQRTAAEKHLQQLGNLRTPRLFINSQPYIILAVVGGFAAVLAWWLGYRNIIQRFDLYITAPAFAIVAVIIALLAGKYLYKISQANIQKVYQAFQNALQTASANLHRRHKLALEQLDQVIQKAKDERSSGMQAAREKLHATQEEILQRREVLLCEIEIEYTQNKKQLEQQRTEKIDQVNQVWHESQNQLNTNFNRNMGEINQRTELELKNGQEQYETAIASLQQRWSEGLACIEALLKETANLDPEFLKNWHDTYWQQWAPDLESDSCIRFGRIDLESSQLDEQVKQQIPFQIDPTQPVPIPAVMSFPDRGSMLIQSSRAGRQIAIQALRATMTRLFTSLAPGKVQFTILDPIGLGENFAGFMHATDFEEALVGKRIWTDETQIQQQLVNLTNHMENVIQKYLRNDFETIDEYNLQAGELAEPYRFLIIADFPTNFHEQSARRLVNILNSGTRCGVYTLIVYNDRQELPVGIELEDLTTNTIHLVYDEDRFIWQDDIFSHFPLTLDKPPTEEVLTHIMRGVGQAAKDSQRVEVPFQIIAPEDDQIWSQDSKKELRVPVGRTGATRLQYLNIGKGVTQHMLIAGKTGSGKSTLLHVIISNLALWYSPAEVELYLIDFKQGVEFKTYVTNQLPHARAIAIESDREFGLSILQRLSDEMGRRGDLFRKAGVQDLGAYRETTGAVLPRTVLIVDEFQIFFSDDDKLAQDAALLLEQLVRQGRAFGIHVLLGSQTLSGSSGLARSTIGQMVVRIALQCSEADSQLILDDDNVAARLLTRPGEAIYNDNSGMVAGNSPFQTAWLSDALRDDYLKQITKRVKDQPIDFEPPIVFEGNEPADIQTNRLLTYTLASQNWSRDGATPCGWLGEPVAIKDPTAARFHRRSGSNLLIVGQQDKTAVGLLSSALISLAAQYEPQSVRFIILDGRADETTHSGQLQDLAARLPHDHCIVPWRQVAQVIDDLSCEVQKRQDEQPADAPDIYVLIYDLQRYRVLRRNEDDFGFSMNEEAKPKPDKQFSDIIRDGPAVGVHVLVWADTLNVVERTLDRQLLREFDYRVLFQMSSADSSHLIDTPLANQLGFHRALFYSEEQGLLEKFRPYTHIDPQWLDTLVENLHNKSAAS